MNYNIQAPFFIFVFHFFYYLIKFYHFYNNQVQALHSAWNSALSSQIWQRIWQPANKRTGAINYQKSINFRIQIISYMSLTLYYHILSQPSRAVLALLKLGRIQYQGRVLNLFEGQARTPDYLKLNSFGGVPFIVHQGLHLAQSNAILTYLTEAYPKELGKYNGRNARERAHINQYLSWYQGTYRPNLLRPLRTKLAAWRTNKPFSRKSYLDLQEKAMQSLDFLETRFSDKSPYIVGNHLSIADLLLYHQTTNLEVLNFPLTKWKKTEGWYKAVQSDKVIGEIHQQLKKQTSELVQAISQLKSTE